MSPSEAGSSPARPSPTIRVRDARPCDAPSIVAFNMGLALETEHKRLDEPTLRRGVASALADPDRLRYWVAEADTEGAPVVVGQAAITREWSDWRNGWLWWFQSVYVAPEWRGRGVFRRLHAHIRASALAEGDIVGLRLYVERDNDPARATYLALGLRHGGYEVLEEIWPDRFGGDYPGVSSSGD